MNTSLHFYIENRIDNNLSNKDSVGGIGLENVVKRLNLIYPNKHKLNRFTKEDKYIIDLYIELE